ncbi:MAG: leucine-rich repeat domain-containing protein [Muribaculaceae bacterium]|nr:leucine-rich repeat domain-containing protein [Muribaculaceae bacterium]
MHKSLLTLFLLFSLFVNAATYDFHDTQFFYKRISEADKTVELVAGDAPYTGDIVLPEHINTGGQIYRVVRVGVGAFRDCSEVTSIHISSSITHIGEYAFSGTAITRLSIPANVTRIDDRICAQCDSLKELIIEDDTTTLAFKASDNFMFYGCPISKVYIGRNLTYKYRASYPNPRAESPFESVGSTLTDVELGDNVTVIYHRMFSKFE